MRGPYRAYPNLVKGGSAQYKIHVGSVAEFRNDSGVEYSGSKPRLPPWLETTAPVWPRPGAVLQAGAPPGADSNHAIEQGFEPESSTPESFQNSATLPTWVV